MPSIIIGSITYVHGKFLKKEGKKEGKERKRGQVAVRKRKSEDGNVKFIYTDLCICIKMWVISKTF